MSLYDDSFCRHQLEQCNIYSGVKWIMKNAVEAVRQSNYQLRNSQAITCVVQNKPANEMLHIDDTQSAEDLQIKELYCTVDSKSICDAVYDSYFDSKAAGYLIYTYNNIVDKHQRARVRVLTRMLWYRLKD